MLRSLVFEVTRLDIKANPKRVIATCYPTQATDQIIDQDKATLRRMRGVTAVERKLEDGQEILTITFAKNAPQENVGAVTNRLNMLVLANATIAEKRLAGIDGPISLWVAVRFPNWVLSSRRESFDALATACATGTAPVTSYRLDEGGRTCELSFAMVSSATTHYECRKIVADLAHGLGLWIDDADLAVVSRAS